MSLGETFSDNLIIQSKVASRIPKTRTQHWWQGAGRALLLTIFLGIALFVLTARLFALTIIDGHRFRSLADENRTKELVRHAPRGIIYDRAGNPLVKNIPRFRLLSPCADRPSELCVKRITEAEGKQLEQQGLPPKHFLEVEYLRQYVFPESTAHVVGYTGEISADELQDNYFELRKYQRGDQIGRTATEVVFEDKLRGRNGKELVEVDANGKILRVLGRDQELSGEDITLSIDGELSEVVKRAYPPSAKGAVIVSIPRTGEILAMYSNPTYSLNSFSLGMSQEEYDDLIADTRRPMFNRAISGIYPPASTYKLLISWAALEKGTINGSTKIEDTGVVTIGTFKFHNWYFTRYGKTDGLVDVVRALAHSNDIFFYKVGEMLGVSSIYEWSKKFKLGNKLGIELPGEAEGILPNAQWKNTRFATDADIEARNNIWYVGDTYHLSIGQGYLLTTPLQVNAWTNALANNGVMCKPTILKVTGNKRASTDCVTIPMEEDTRALITRGMIEACDENGTAYPLFNYSVPLDPTSESTASAERKKIPIACKTGTAEYGDPQNKTHAWITLFAPVPSEYINKQDSAKQMVTGESEIAITVLVEEGGEGSAIAAPIAKEILDYWFTR